MNIYAAGSIIDFKYTSTEVSGSPSSWVDYAAAAYKSNSTTQTSSGITITPDFDGIIGLNHIRVDTAANTSFYTTDTEFDVVANNGNTADLQMPGMVLFHFRLGTAFTTADRTKLSDIETDTQDIQSRLPAALVDGRMAAEDGGPRTWYVSTTAGNDSNTGLSRAAPKLTFASAQTAASNGDTIEMLTSSSSTAVTVSKSLTVKGIRNSAYGHTITVSSGTAITIIAHHVTLDGFSGVTTDAVTGTSAGILATGRDGITLRRCKAGGVINGLRLYNASNVVLDNVFALSEGDNSSEAAFLEGGKNWDIRNCQFRKVGAGTLNMTACTLYGALHGTLYNNRFEVVKTIASAADVWNLVLTADDSALSPLYDPANNSEFVEPPFVRMQNNLFFVDIQGVGDTGEINCLKEVVGNTDDGAAVYVEGSQYMLHTQAGNTVFKYEGDAEAKIAVRGGDVTPSEVSGAGIAVLDLRPSNFHLMGINASGHLSRVTLTDTATALTEDVAGAGAQAVFDNEEVAEHRVLKISTRSDGTTTIVYPARVRIGEPITYWLNMSPQLGKGVWIDDVDNVLSSDDTELGVTAGVNRELVVVHLDATNAVAGTDYTVTMNVVPFPGKVIKVKLNVEVLDD